MAVKNQTWSKTAQEYNASVTLRRSVEVLKNYWKNLKGDAKKAAAQERQIGMMKTGGGPAPQLVQDPIISRVLILIRPAAEGLLNSFDTDGIFDTAAAVDGKENDTMQDEELELEPARR